MPLPSLSRNDGEKKKNIRSDLVGISTFVSHSPPLLVALHAKRRKLYGIRTSSVANRGKMPHTKFALHENSGKRQRWCIAHMFFLKLSAVASITPEYDR